MRRPPVNLGAAERGGRVAAGLAGIVAGSILLASASGLPTVILELALVAAGLDLVVTGVLGFCPLYAGLGYAPRSLWRPR